MPPARPLSILVVDDYADAADALAALLVLSGYSARTCYAADDALRAAAAHPPDVVILEVRLRSDSGYDLADRLTRGLGKRPVFVAVATLPDKAGHSAAAGFAAHFVKTDDTARLLSFLHSLFPDPAG